MNDPCAYCDTMGPFVRDEQPVRDLHRIWHEFGRAWNRAYGPLISAFRNLDRAAREATTANYALIPAPNLEHQPMTTPALEAWRVEPGDDIKLTRKMATCAGQVTRIDLSATKGTGFYFDGLPLPHWVGRQHDTWTLVEHHPAIPHDLHPGALYDVTTSDGRMMRAYWSPLDGNRANYAWLHPDGETRFRRGYVTRARLAGTEAKR
jgi:hypothetical protein